MPEKFEPIKVVDTGKDIKNFQVEFSDRSLGDLGKENARLKSYLKDQEDLIKGHLDSFKKAALKEYTGVLKWDNEKAVNQALQDYAEEMNVLLEESIKDLKQISDKYEDSLGDRATADTIGYHFQKVAEEFGPVLEARILNWANVGVGAIITAAEGRAKLPTVAQKTEGIMSDVKTRKQQMEEIGK